MDISYPGFFDRSPNILAPLNCCNLICSCVRYVRKYLKFMEKHFFDHNLVDRGLEGTEMMQLLLPLIVILLSAFLQLMNIAKISIVPLGHQLSMKP